MIFPSFQARDAFKPIARERKYLMDYKLGCLSLDIICSEKRTIFRGRGLRKNASFEEHIMSKDKYPSIFLKSNGDYLVYYPKLLYGLCL